MKDPNVQKEWAERLQIEVMEDYLREAEMSYALRNGKDAEYYERMRGHFEKLKEFISKGIASHNNSLLERLEGLKDIEREAAARHAKIYTDPSFARNQAITESQELIKNSLI